VLDDEPLGLGRLRQTGGLRTKPGERGVGKADGELVDSVEGRMRRPGASAFRVMLSVSVLGS
jgi:hypothetical protein